VAVASLWRLAITKILQRLSLTAAEQAVNTQVSSLVFKRFGMTWLVQELTPKTWAVITT
jgi:hypothetical protein